MREDGPPRLAAWLLSVLLSERYREAVMGDLAEEYVLRLQGATGAGVSRWYWGQVCRSVPPVLWAALRRGRWMGTLGVAIGAYIGAGIVEFSANAALSRLLALGAPADSALGVIVGLMTMVLGGYVATLIRSGAASALAAVIITGVGVLMLAMPDSVPLWYQLAFLIGGPLASLAGGTLFVKKQRRHG